GAVRDADVGAGVEDVQPRVEAVAAAHVDGREVVGAQPAEPAREVVEAVALEQRGRVGLVDRVLEEERGEVVERRDLLHAQLAGGQLAEVDLPDTDGLPWREAITEVTRALHGSFLAHPHLSAILAVQHIDAIAIFKATEVILRALRCAGLADREAVRALDVIT